jgi:hypothetical protein
MYLGVLGCKYMRAYAKIHTKIKTDQKIKIIHNEKRKNYNQNKRKSS